MMKVIFKTLLVFILFSGPAYGDEIVIVSPHWEGYKREFEWAFEDWYRETNHRDVTVRWQDVGGASDIMKYILSRHASKLPTGIDVFFGGGVDVFNDLKSKGLLAKVDVPAEILDEIPLTVQGNPVYDPDHFWFSVNLAGFGISYNRKLLSFLKVAEPVRWEDLGDPALHGWVGSADPRKSGSVRFIYELLLQYYGWEEGWRKIYAIASNVRSFSSNSSQTPKDISMGEIAEGMLIDSYGRDVVRLAGEENAGLAIPQEIPSVFGDGAAILNDAPNPQIARSFISFVLSSRAQALLIKKVGVPGGPRQYELGRFPVRADQYREDGTTVALPNPYLKEGTFRYNPELASRRWRYVTALLGSIAVDLQSEIAFARYAEKISLDSFLPPVTEEQLNDAIASGANPLTLGLNARREFAARLGQQQNMFWGCFTVLLTFLTLGTMTYRKLRR